ncbi:MAG: hypothetical protein LBD70_05090 [Bifidobacteriaceae bacterium]|nr:hypothetical protein [Bifidobacteriaceae bacterium]
MAEPVWLAWPLGSRVTIRRRLSAGGYADVVGRLEEAGAEHVAVRHRDGRLRRVEAREIAIAHLITPPARAAEPPGARLPGGRQRQTRTARPPAD